MRVFQDVCPESCSSLVDLGEHWSEKHHLTPTGPSGDSSWIGGEVFQLCFAFCLVIVVQMPAPQKIMYIVPRIYVLPAAIYEILQALLVAVYTGGFI